MESQSVTIQMKAIHQYFPVVMFIMLYKVVLTFESVDEILKCDYSFLMRTAGQYFPMVWCFSVFYDIQFRFIFMNFSFNGHPRD